ncbi:MAG: hypothetical protein PPP58_07205 [Natronomonas sp.]
MSDDEEPSAPFIASERAETPRELAREETRITFEYQVQRLREIDSKAIEILKANLLLIGILVTGASVLAQPDFRIELFINPFTASGATLLFVSTGLAGVTYTASNLRGGLDPDAIERAVAARVEEDRFEEELLRSYGRWIDYNAQVTAVNDILISVTVLFVIISFAYLAAGVAAGFAGLTTIPMITAFVLFTVPLVWLALRVYHMDHIGLEAPDDTGFSGVRLSKGKDRAEGFTALLQMLKNPPRK